MKNFAYSAAALALLASGSAFAQAGGTQTLPPAFINVSAEVTAACTTLTATDVDFGPASTTDVDSEADSTITVNCAAGTGYTVEIDYGATPQGTGPYIRTVTGTSPQTGEMMDYYIFQDATRLTPWGTVAQSEQFDGQGTGADDQLTAYFTLDRNTGAGPGLYSDVVTVTLTF